MESNPKRRAGVVIGGHTFSAKKHAKARYAQIRDGAPSSGELTHEQETFLLDCVTAHVKIKGWLNEHDGPQVTSPPHTAARSHAPPVSVSTTRPFQPLAETSGFMPRH